MPTLLRIGPYRFYFYSHEPNEPRHVHIDRDECTAKFWLQDTALAQNVGFSAKELRVIQGHVADNREAFEKAWHDFFGA